MKIALTISLALLSFLGMSQDWRDTLGIARDAYKNREYVKALDNYKQAQKGAPDDVDLSDEMAQSAYKAREFEQAEKIYQQNGNSKKTKAEKADNWYNLGNARMKKRDYSGAAEAYKESLRLNPKDEQARYNLSEAIRNIKDQSNKDKQNSGSDQNDQQQGESQEQEGQPQEGDQQGDDPQQPDNQGQLTSKTVEKMLDKLMKDEAETKRRMTEGDQSRNHNKSGKDW